MDSIRRIPQEAADAAVSAVARTMRLEREKAAVCMRLLSSGLIGRVVNRRIEKDLQELFPQYCIRYSTENKWATFYSEEKPGCLRDTFTLRLLPYRRKQEDKRLTKEALEEQKKDAEKRAADYCKKLEEFPDALAQYNAVAEYFQNLRWKIYDVMVHGNDSRYP